MALSETTPRPTVEDRTQTTATRSRRRTSWTRLLFLLPMVLYLALVFAYPIYHNTYVSFHDYGLRSLITGEAEFVGLANFADAFADPRFELALRNTVIFTVVSLVVQYVIGLLLALYFQGRFPLSRTLRSLLILPWLTPPIASVAAWRWLFTDNGFINEGLTMLGLEPVGWMTQPTSAFAAIILVNIWIGVSFNLILLHSGLEGIPKDRYEAAEVDGAGYWKRVWHIALPGLRPITAVVLTLGVIYTLRQFELIWAMTRGGPGNSTHLLSTLSYTISFDNSQYGLGAAVANIVFAITLVLVLGYARGIRKES